MTTDLQKLSTALTSDTSEQRLERQIRKQAEEIRTALRRGDSFTVQDGKRKLSIKIER